MVLILALAFGDHDARRVTRLDHDGAGEAFGRFGDGVDFLARGHVVRFEEGAVEHGFGWVSGRVDGKRNEDGMEIRKGMRF